MNQIQVVQKKLLSTKQTKVLIVDDSEAIRLALKEILMQSKFSFKFLEADNGVDAVKTFQEEKPEMVIMDVYMPRANGVQALATILKLNRQAKVIMITAAAKSRIVQDSMRLGARDYILKPFDRYVVNSVIGKILNQTW